ncbi:hypothetical protein L1080_025920 [Rhodococcus sp. MSC1_016]|jgi:hypothetical protein|uniref:hypothetical protein n=1 Tax=Rhodococcus sp. MSC1_016 TaxID=2909266 RepID=UPI0019178C56|nr:MULTISPECIES: hypothetical protein [unclassified Rhodococcus (in: high G+C Gram-positive bacteria)]
MDAIDSPAAGVGGLLELVTSPGDVAAVGAGEEIEVLCRAGAQLLGDQCCAAGQEEALAGRQGEE